MKVEKKKVNVKGYGNRKHEIAIERTEMSGYTFISVLKNGNAIIKCTPKEFVKIKRLFCD